MDTSSILTYIACIIVLFLVGRIFIVPLKSIVKLVFNSLLGAILIWLVNVIGSIFQFHMGLNMVTSIVVGLLGIPGAILLILLRIFL